MSRANLLHMGDTPAQQAVFSFEHMMAHRNAFGVMSPLNRFSVLPYLLYPMTFDMPAGKWNLNHQQAHDDALRNLPSEFGSSRLGLAIGANLVDSDQTSQRTWWMFVNHLEHYVGGNTILPNVTFPPPAPQWVYPFG